MAAVVDTVERRALDAISATRIAARLDELARIGRQPSGGITRLALSPEEQAARELVSEWLRPLGYRCGLDEAANLVAQAPPSDSGILIGSHLDTVPDGGPYDGALGVVVAIEVAEALHAVGATLMPRIVAWMGEEGPRFGRTLLGSAAALGLLEDSDWQRRSLEGLTVRELAKESRRAWRGDVEASATTRADVYLELHMEQGPQLEEWGIPVAVVSAIAGATHARVTVVGGPNHAGTTSMALRRDALIGAAEMVLATEQEAAEAANGLVATVGHIHVDPGAQNVIPGRAIFTLDVRAPSDSARRAYMEKYASVCDEIAARRQLSVAVSDHTEVGSVALDSGLRAVLADSLIEIGQPARELASGAVHDAQTWALAGRRAGMLFVRSRAGSHNPFESVSPEDAALGGQALLLAVSRLQRRSG